jgi:hypothetical protein
MAADDFATRKIEGGEQRRRPMPLIIVRLAGHGAPVGQLQIALRTFERLDRWLFVDGENDGVFGRRHVEPDDLGCLGREFGVVAFAPRLAAGEVDLVRAQKAPDILDMDVVERLGDERAAPVGVTLGCAVSRKPPLCGSKWPPLRL